MTMYERYCKVRDAKGLKDSHVASAAQIGKSTFSDWKSGRSIPKNDKLQRIANVLGVSFEWLTTGEEKENNPGYYFNDETAKAAQEIFENKELRMLFDAARTADPEDLRALHNMALALKRKERGYTDDTGC